MKCQFLRSSFIMPRQSGPVRLVGSMHEWLGLGSRPPELVRQVQFQLSPSSSPIITRNHVRPYCLSFNHV